MRIFAEIEPEHPDKITLPNVAYELRELCKTVPGLRYDTRLKNGTWRIALNWASCLALRGAFKERLEVGPVLNAWAAEEKATRIDPAMALREALDAPGLEGLYPFQRAGVAFLTVARRALCADDMGTGKTRQAICTIGQHYVNGENPFPCLIVAPNSMKYAWAREIEEVWPGMITTVIHGSVTARRKQLATPSHFYVINWEGVRSHSRLVPYGSIALKKCEDCGGMDEAVSDQTCQFHDKELNHMTFNSVIADEVHRMKDGKAQQTRAVKSASGDADIRIGLSGTPFGDTPVELWSILNWLAPEEHPSKTGYIDQYLFESMDMYGTKTWPGLKAETRDQFFAVVHPRMRRMPKELVLKDLPPLVYERRDLVMKPKQKKAYEQMRKNMLAELDDGQLMVTTQPMVRAKRMLQFASSYAEVENTDVWDEDEQEWKVKQKAILKAPSNKIDAFLGDLKEGDFGDSQIVVFAESRQLIELLSAEMTKKDLEHGLITGAIDADERQIFIDDFQAGYLRFMLCTTAAGGTGVTLTAANVAVFLQRPRSMFDNEQAEARVRRIGSEIHDSITIVDYVSSGTLDEVVIEQTLAKTGRLQDILNDESMLRRHLETGPK